MAIRSVKNQYPGVNAHMHSFWQGRDKWNWFHNVYIGQLLLSLRAILIPMGYMAQIEDSLQIRRRDDKLTRPQADILIRDREPEHRSQRSESSSAVQTLTLDELEEEEEDREHPYSAIVVYPRSGEMLPDKAITWIELLSPTNKVGADRREYRRKRTDLLQAGLAFVEIDYLHETPPTFWKLPDYTMGEADSHPYRIIVIDPRPEYHEGRASIYQFDVDQPIPTVAIPLSGDDQIQFNFDADYQRTFEAALYGEEVDYRELPMTFEHYSRDDQTRIAVRMLAILEAARTGVNLETGPFPVKTVGLEEALERIQQGE
jgi:Protein of unknown function (DUF4058)